MRQQPCDADLAGPFGNARSMMFMIPMPPTSSETLAMAPSKTASTREVSVAASAISSVRTVKCRLCRADAVALLKQ
jgi:hypothetical protein